MKTPQLVSGALALAIVAVGCNRADTSEQAQQAAAEVRSAASRAGDQLADGWLMTKIQAQYFADDDIKARYINVSSHDRVVTLTGYVENEATRQEAVQIAKNTDGVRSVQDQLLIGRRPNDAFESKPSTSGTPEAVATAGNKTENAAESAVERLDDGRITTTIQAKYFLDPVVKGRRVDVDTRSGIVTLRGEVASEEERAKALAMARETAGVQRVEDNLSVNAAIDRPAAESSPSSTGPAATAVQRVEDATIIAAVKARFVADRQIKTGDIDVNARDGVVTLEGKVPDRQAKLRAQEIARSTTGVTQVIDRLVVTK